MSRTRELLIALCLACAGMPAAASTDLSASYSYHDNPNLASVSAQQRPDRVLDVGADWSRLKPIDHRLSWTLSAGLDVQRWDRWSGLDGITGSVGIGLRYKPGLGREVSRYHLHLGWERREADDAARDRDGWVLDAGLTRPLSGGHVVRMGYRYRELEARGAVFDVSDHRFELAYDRNLGRWGVLGLSLALRDGDVTAVTRPDPGLRDVSRAAAPDPVFGADWIAYRLDARSEVLGLEWLYFPGDAGELSLGAEAFRADADAGPVYDGMIWRLAYRHSF